MVAVEVSGNGFAVLTRIARTGSGVSHGATASISEMVLDTIGAIACSANVRDGVGDGDVVPVLDRTITESAGVRKLVEPPAPTA